MLMCYYSVITEDAAMLLALAGRKPGVHVICFQPVSSEECFNGELGLKSDTLICSMLMCYFFIINHAIAILLHAFVVFLSRI